MGRFFVAPKDIPKVPQVHGEYVILSIYDPRCDSVRRYSSETKGRHLHEDFLIAKIDRRVDRNGWTGSLNMPEEFFFNGLGSASPGRTRDFDARSTPRVINPR